MTALLSLAQQKYLVLLSASPWSGRQKLDSLGKEKYCQCVPKVKAVLDKLSVLELAPDVSDNNELRLLQAFLSEGANWPLLDMLNVVQNLDKSRDIFLDSVKSLPIVVRIKAPYQSFNTKETYAEQESYYEEVVIKPGGFFKKAVTEKQKKTRMVTKTRTVLNGSSGPEPIFEFCPISAGSFRMGANERYFYLGRYPVTQQQWEAVMGNNPSHFKGDTLPVETVSWDDAQTFIHKLNHLSGKQRYRLPTEAEWEYACRAGTTSEYYFGDDASRLEEYAWYDSNSEGTIHPVGLKKPNGLGLYDMTGNVWEWCSVSGSSDRVLRGGGWTTFAGDCRSALLYYPPPDYCHNGVGFRLVFLP
jgi:formylglycine-generating enzyme required for sulfatase activity